MRSWLYIFLITNFLCFFSSKGFSHSSFDPSWLKGTGKDFALFQCSSPTYGAAWLESGLIPKLFKHGHLIFVKDSPTDRTNGSSALVELVRLLFHQVSEGGEVVRSVNTRYLPAYITSEVMGGIVGSLTCVVHTLGTSNASGAELLSSLLEKQLFDPDGPLYKKWQQVEKERLVIVAKRERLQQERKALLDKDTKSLTLFMNKALAVFRSHGKLLKYRSKPGIRLDEVIAFIRREFAECEAALRDICPLALEELRKSFIECDKQSRQFSAEAAELKKQIGQFSSQLRGKYSSWDQLKEYLRNFQTLVVRAAMECDIVPDGTVKFMKYTLHGILLAFMCAGATSKACIKSYMQTFFKAMKPFHSVNISFPVTWEQNVYCVAHGVPTLRSVGHKYKGGLPAIDLADLGFACITGSRASRQFPPLWTYKKPKSVVGSNPYPDCAEGVVKNLVDFVLYKSERACFVTNQTSMPTGKAFSLDTQVSSFYTQHSGICDANTLDLHQGWVHCIEHVPYVLYNRCLNRLKNTELFVIGGYIYGNDFGIDMSSHPTGMVPIVLHGKTVNLVDPARYYLYELTPCLRSFTVLLNNMFGLQFFDNVVEQVWQSKKFYSKYFLPFIKVFGWSCDASGSLPAARVDSAELALRKHFPLNIRLKNTKGAPFEIRISENHAVIGLPGRGERSQANTRQLALQLWDRAASVVGEEERNFSLACLSVFPKAAQLHPSSLLMKTHLRGLQPFLCDIDDFTILIELVNQVLILQKEECFPLIENLVTHYSGFDEVDFFGRLLRVLHRFISEQSARGSLATQLAIHAVEKIKHVDAVSTLLDVMLCSTNRRLWPYISPIFLKQYSKLTTPASCKSVLQKLQAMLRQDGRYFSMTVDVPDLVRLGCQAIKDESSGDNDFVILLRDLFLFWPDVITTSVGTLLISYLRESVSWKKIPCNNLHRVLVAAAHKQEFLYKLSQAVDGWKQAEDIEVRRRAVQGLQVLVGLVEDGQEEECDPSSLLQYVCAGLHDSEREIRMLSRDVLVQFALQEAYGANVLKKMLQMSRSKRWNIQFEVVASLRKLIHKFRAYACLVERRQEEVVVGILLNTFTSKGAHVAGCADDIITDMRKSRDGMQILVNGLRSIVAKANYSQKKLIPFVVKVIKKSSFERFVYCGGIRLLRSILHLDTADNEEMHLLLIKSLLTLKQSGLRDVESLDQEIENVTFCIGRIYSYRDDMRLLQQKFQEVLAF